MSWEMEVTTLGRGGSDTTATALACVLGAEKVEIYTDVEGVMTADPRVYPSTRAIPQLTYEEMGEMANEGAKVLHGRCISLAQKYRIPLWVKGSFCPEGGSLVSEEIPVDALEKVRVVTGLVSVSDIVEVNVDFSGLWDPSCKRTELFRRIWEAGISLDMINVCYNRLFFIVRGDVCEKVEKILAEAALSFEIRRGCAKVSVIGIGMKGTPGVMARIQDALNAAGVEVLRSTDSHITISCLIREEQLGAALAALHRKFGL